MGIALDQMAGILMDENLGDYHMIRLWELRPGAFFLPERLVGKTGWGSSDDEKTRKSCLIKK